MIVEQAAQYIERHRGTHSDIDIRNALLIAGYIEEDIDDSFTIVDRQRTHSGSTGVGWGSIAGLFASGIFTVWIFEGLMSHWNMLSTLMGFGILLGSDALAISLFRSAPRGSFMRGFTTVHLIIGVFAGLSALDYIF